MRRNRGVTLVEILLTAVVVGAGLSVVLSAITTSIRAEVYADNKVKAARLIDLQIGRIQGGVLPLQSQSGDFSEDGEPDFSFTVLQEDTQQQYLEQMTVTVQWNEHGEPRDLDAVFYYYADPNAQNNTLGGATTQGSLMGSNGGGAKGSLLGSGSGGNSGSLMGSGGGGNSGSLIGNGSGSRGGGGASGSAFGGGGGAP
ncbi:MAG TPA: type II secretion system protein [Planctomycetota bacterium]|nr:type II secretion system protein [Planctomycetota bacterium]